MSKIYIKFPPNACAGGVESIFQGCNSINEMGGDCSLVYDGPVLDNPIPREYEVYEHVKAVHESEMHRSKDTLVILPEVDTQHIPRFKDCVPCVWWLSIDNNHGRYQDFTDDEVYHLYQSEYAKQYLTDKGAKNIVPYHDYIQGFVKSDVPKEDQVCFNPAKGMRYTQFIAQHSPGVKFVAINGMTKSQVMNELSKSKIYIDFGHHPGRDRIPREAALAGCLVVTSNIGSARFEEDVPIPDSYKFNELNPNIGEYLKDLMNNYQERSKDFDHYREVIGGQNSVQLEEARNIMKLVELNDESLV